MRRTHDTSSSRTTIAALAIAAIALFVALGGPAYAAKLIDGKTIKAKSITSVQLADGSVTLAKLSKSARTSLSKGKSPMGDRGATGVRGAAGVKGPKGHAGGLDVYDAKNHRIGTFEGYFSSFLLVANDQGAIFAYDVTPSINYPLFPPPSVLYYKDAGCDGQPYTVVGSWPTNFAILLGAPPSAGDSAWIARAGNTESFTAHSVQTSGGCQDTTSAVTNALPADPAGEVPAVKKPLVLKPKT